jgi:CHAT domain-containing protein
MADGDLLSADNKYGDARGRYEDARLLLDGVGDVTEMMVAECREAQLDLRLSKPQDATLTLEALTPFFKARGYKWLLGQSQLGLADAGLSLNDYSKAIAHSEAGLAVLRDTGDSSSVTSALCQLGVEYRAVGRHHEALAFLQQALGMCDPGTPPRNLWLAYSVMGATCDSLGFADTALDCYREALFFVRRSNASPLYVSRSYAFAALALRKLSAFDEAIKNAQLGFDLGRGLSDPSVSKNIMAFSSLAMGEIYRSARRFKDAISSYDVAAEYYGELGLPDKILEAHKGRFLTLVAEQDGRGAKEELNQALSLLETLRGKVVEESNQRAFFSEVQDLYDVATDYVYSSARDPWGAFNLAEASKARSLNDLIVSGGGVIDGLEGPDLIANSRRAPLSGDEIRKLMPPDCQLLEYSVLADSVLIWVISKDAVFSHKVENLRSGALEEKVGHYLSLIAEPSEDLHAIDLLAEELFDLLVDPVLAYLDANKQVCVVPDKSLNYLPFHALHSRSRRSYLVEDYTLSYSPSANIFINRCDLAQSKEMEPDESILAVGNPAFDQSLFGLPGLGGAVREAETICRYYPRHHSLIGPQARKDAVVEQMTEASVIEFATHCVVDQMSALRSQLILAKEPGIPEEGKSGSGTLQTREIYRTRLPHAKLVILSGCRTAIEQSFKGEGAIGMARAFMVAGAPLVVASLWPVDSESAADQMIDFHRLRRQERQPTAMALRQAQRNRLDGAQGRARNPYYWAPFIVIGGSSKF